MMNGSRQRNRLREFFFGELQQTDTGDALQRASAEANGMGSSAHRARYNAEVQKLAQSMRQTVVEDLADLLNTIPFETVMDLDPHPQVQDSVLNFGANQFTGMTLDHGTLQRLAMDMRERILNFEPLMIEDSIVVEVLDNLPDKDPRTLFLAIHGVLKYPADQPALRIETCINLDTGKVTLSES